MIFVLEGNNSLYLITYLQYYKKIILLIIKINSTMIIFLQVTLSVRSMQTYQNNEIFKNKNYFINWVDDILNQVH